MGDAQPGSTAKDGVAVDSSSDNEVVDFLKVLKRQCADRESVVSYTAEPDKRVVGKESMESPQRCTRPRIETTASSCHVYRQSDCHKFEGVDWLQCMAPEIQQAQSIFCGRPMLINTMCSSMGGAAAALKAPVIHIVQPAYTTHT